MNGIPAYSRMDPPQILTSILFCTSFISNTHAPLSIITLMKEAFCCKYAGGIQMVIGISAHWSWRPLCRIPRTVWDDYPGSEVIACLSPFISHESRILSILRATRFIVARFTMTKGHLKKCRPHQTTYTSSALGTSAVSSLMLSQTVGHLVLYAFASMDSHSVVFKIMRTLYHHVSYDFQPKHLIRFLRPLTTTNS